MKQFFKDLFTSNNLNSIQHQQPIYSYQIPIHENVRTPTIKGPADAGPAYNIAGL
jgi:hypothetical protein